MMEVVAKLFNWMWALDNALSISRHGRGLKLEWVQGAFTGGDVEVLLRSYGIRVYGRKIAWKEGDTWACHVRSEQAKWADTLLRTKGVPLVSKQRGKALSAMPRPWGVPVEGVGLTGRLIDVMGSGPQKGRKK